MINPINASLQIILCSCNANKHGMHISLVADFLTLRIRALHEAQKQLSITFCSIFF